MNRPPLSREPRNRSTRLTPVSGAAEGTKASPEMMMLPWGRTSPARGLARSSTGAVLVHVVEDDAAVADWAPTGAAELTTTRARIVKLAATGPPTRRTVECREDMHTPSPRVTVGTLVPRAFN